MYKKSKIENNKKENREKRIIINTNESDSKKKPTNYCV